jgi:F-box and WD-40 domain protein 1/11
VFRKNYKRTPPPGLPAAAYTDAGKGLGVVKPGQDWKMMFKARLALQKRWNKGVAARIDLTGHTDSVYCVQYDE